VAKGWVTAVTALSWAYLTIVTGLGIALWSLSDEWWPATILLFLARWILLLPLLVLLPAAVAVHRAALAPLAVAALLVVWPVMGFRSGWRRLLPHPAGTHVRVVSFNADGGDRIAPNLRLLLAQWEPDVVALQECGRDLAEAMRQLRDWNQHRVRQLCFLSRYPILDAKVMDRTVLDIVSKDEVAGIGGAGDVARYTVQTPVGAVSITNLHLETPRKGLDELVTGNGGLRRLRQNTELRRIESKLARQFVDSGHGPTLVAGDFNTPVESRIFGRSWRDLTDAFSRVGFGFGMTKANGWIRVRIDHVLSGPGWTADAVTVGRDVGSDHRPLIVDLTLAPGS
jgi:endonuclease/exonuclease/phosphatase (EEP) superfamily protein YafD